MPGRENIQYRQRIAWAELMDGLDAITTAFEGELALVDTLALNLVQLHWEFQSDCELLE